MQSSFIYTLETIHVVVDELCSYMPQVNVFTFTGSLGSGKTTLIRLLLERQGVSDLITSPTFTYVNIYQVDTRLFYHFDLYRIESVDHFLFAGFDEYLYQPNSWSFIEWPAPILPLLKHKACHITIDYVDEQTRSLQLQLVK